MLSQKRQQVATRKRKKSFNKKRQLYFQIKIKELGTDCLGLPVRYGRLSICNFYRSGLKEHFVNQPFLILLLNCPKPSPIPHCCFYLLSKATTESKIYNFVLHLLYTYVLVKVRTSYSIGFIASWPILLQSLKTIFFKHVFKIQIRQ